MKSETVIDSSRAWQLSSRLGGVLVLALVLWVAPGRLVAEEHGSSEGQHEASGESHEVTGEEHEAGEEHAEEHGEGHHLHKHHFAVILGATEAVEEHGEEHTGNGHEDGHGETQSESTSSSKDDPDFTIGLDYERRLSQLIGVGGTLDWVVEGRREFLLGPIGFLHPFAGSKFWLAPLAERVRETGDWELVVRIGAGWDIPIGKSGRYSIAPTVNYDIGEEHELWNVGLAIGRGW